MSTHAAADKERKEHAIYEVGYSSGRGSNLRQSTISSINSVI